MKTLNYYLEACKLRKGLDTDAELASFLKIKAPSLSIMKKGGGASQETAERIAEGAGVALEEVWLASLIQKEQNPRFKHILENISKMSGIAASITVASVITLAFSSAGALSNLSSFYNQVCILC